ncbi:MAG: NUDIX hydrolase [Micrococcales bacterium]|nr:NUDIX hydrolase [Micrococcales bacterium]
MIDALLHPVLEPGSVRDRIDPRPVSSSETAFAGMVWDVQRERVDLGEAGCVTREFVKHPGAVAVLALDDHERIVMIQQYRHPVGAYEWELPAGLLDQPGEDPALAAARELAEEVDLRAERWDVLIDYFSSPGGLDEALRVYVARGLSAVPEGERHTRDAEEHGMPTGWVSLDDAHDAVLAGRLHNPSACISILAAHASRARDWATLRPADSPWPEHPAYR